MCSGCTFFLFSVVRLASVKYCIPSHCEAWDPIVIKGDVAADAGDPPPPAPPPAEDPADGGADSDDMLDDLLRAAEQEISAMISYMMSTCYT